MRKRVSVRHIQCIKVMTLDTTGKTLTFGDTRYIDALSNIKSVDAYCLAQFAHLVFVDSKLANDFADRRATLFKVRRLRLAWMLARARAHLQSTVTVFIG